MRKLFLLLIIISATVSFAQTPQPATPTPPATKTVIGYFNYDSLLVLIPGYKAAVDSAKLSKKDTDTELYNMEATLALKQYEYDSLKHHWSPVIESIKEHEINDIKARIAEYKTSFPPYKPDPILLLKSELKITAAANKIAKEKGYSAVINSKNSSDGIICTSSSMHFVNMTKDICAELGIR